MRLLICLIVVIAAPLAHSDVDLFQVKLDYSISGGSKLRSHLVVKEFQKLPFIDKEGNQIEITISDDNTDGVIRVQFDYLEKGKDDEEPKSATLMIAPQKEGAVKELSNAGESQLDLKVKVNKI